MLHGAAYLNASRAVGECFDHTGEACGGVEQVFEVAQVVGQCLQIDLHDGLVRLFKDTLVYLVFVVSECSHDRCAGAYVLVCGVFYDYIAVRKEQHFLCSFLLQGIEVLSVFGSDVGEHSHGRSYDPLEVAHFAGL